MNTDSSSNGIVLLVDDNPTNLGVLFDSLSDSGFRLLAAQDGEGAIDQVKYLKPDIILLDVMMPGIDGFETCRRLKADPATQDIPIIFMTALTDTVDKLTGFSLGAVDYITKPFQTAEVLARIQAHLEVKRLQHALQAQNHQLQAEIRDREQAEQSLRVLLHAVSHDLRNPVTGMLMVLKNLIKTYGEGQICAAVPDTTGQPTIPVPRSIVERMIESGDRQLTLINSLLEAHTIETQGLALRYETIQLRDLILSVVEEVQPLLTKNRATLTTHLADDLPTIQGDPNQLWRVLENLVGNALKHNPPGLVMEISTHLAGETIYCEIKDNGVGIPQEQAPGLFELYRRGSNARHTHGLGLGLYLCRQIVRAHGGEVGVQSDTGQGSAFWFTLPLHQPNAPAPTSETAAIAL